MRVKNYTEAVRLALCAGQDAANRRMRNAGRKNWSHSDYNHAARVTEGQLVDLGFDVARWAATAGFPRNEPDEPKPARKRKSRAKSKLIQLDFAFA